MKPDFYFLMFGAEDFKFVNKQIWGGGVAVIAATSLTYSNVVELHCG